MKARLVEDKQHFERGKNIRSAMDLGGITLQPEKARRQEKLDQDVADLINKSNQEWNEYLKKMFIGKTVTFLGKKLGKMDRSGKGMSKTERDEFTFKVDDVLVSGSEAFISSTIIFSDGENMYTLEFLNTKIYIGE